MTTIMNEDGETRFTKALRDGTYEHLRDRLTELVTDSGLSHAEAGEILGYSKSTIRFICQVLDVRGGFHLKMTWQMNLSERAQIVAERRLAHIIRVNCPWDRGW